VAEEKQGGARPGRPGKNVRALAADVLFECHRRVGVFAHDRVHAVSLANRLNRRDRRFLTELVFGVLRHERTLDCIVAAHSDTKFDEIGPRAKEALRLGTYQLLYLDGVPPFAAIHETVAIVRDARARPFVNGVLRGIDRRVRRVPLERDRGGASPQKRLQIGERKVCFFSEEVFADPERDLATHLAQLHSHPTELVARWLARHGEAKTKEMLAKSDEPPPLFVRANRLKATREQLIERLRAEEIACVEGGLGSSVRVLAPPHELVATRAFTDGLCTVQDETSMRVAPALHAKPTHLILDLCAAPGGKATHLAELTDDKATILAVDKSEERLEKLRESIARLGLKSIACMVADATAEDSVKAVAPAPFDRVLVDAPCSNTGVLARRPEAKSRFDASHLAELVALQKAILAQAYTRLFPGGLLAYSTCSLESEENEEQARAFVAAHPDLELIEESLTLPAAGSGDGGYYAVVKRKAQPAA
jgi:16S rRNA (cytosine967-C5)-methyltransferase